MNLFHHVENLRVHKQAEVKISRKTTSYEHNFHAFRNCCLIVTYLISFYYVFLTDL